MLSVEELLRPRYKVIADFPQWSAFKHTIGDILEKKGIHFVGTRTAKAIVEWEMDKYPHLFEKLEWYEEREEKDMPKFIKRRLSESGEYEIRKVERSDGVKLLTDDNRVAYFEWFEPATESEYINQNK